MPENNFDVPKIYTTFFYKENSESLFIVAVHSDIGQTKTAIYSHFRQRLTKEQIDSPQAARRKENALQEANKEAYLEKIVTLCMEEAKNYLQTTPSKSNPEKMLSECIQNVVYYGDLNLGETGASNPNRWPDFLKLDRNTASSRLEQIVNEQFPNKAFSQFLVYGNSDFEREGLAAYFPTSAHIVLKTASIQGQQKIVQAVMDEKAKQVQINKESAQEKRSQRSSRRASHITSPENTMERTSNRETIVPSIINDVTSNVEEFFNPAPLESNDELPLTPTHVPETPPITETHQIIEPTRRRGVSSLFSCWACFSRRPPASASTQVRANEEHNVLQPERDVLDENISVGVSSNPGSQASNQSRGSTGSNLLLNVLKGREAAAPVQPETSLTGTLEESQEGLKKDRSRAGTRPALHRKIV